MCDAVRESGHQPLCEYLAIRNPEVLRDPAEEPISWPQGGAQIDDLIRIVNANRARASMGGVMSPRDAILAGSTTVSGDRGGGPSIAGSGPNVSRLEIMTRNLLRLKKKACERGIIIELIKGKSSGVHIIDNFSVSSQTFWFVIRFRDNKYPAIMSVGNALPDALASLASNLESFLEGTQQ